MRFRVALLAPAVAVASARAMGAQTSTRLVPDELSCASCAISVSAVLTIGDAKGPGEIQNYSHAVMRDARGRIWVLNGGAKTNVYSAAGVFLQQIGTTQPRRGQFSVPIDALQLPGDSVLVFDENDRAMVVGPDLVPGRTIVLPEITPRTSVLVAWPDAVWINGIIRGSGASLFKTSFASDEARIVASVKTGVVEPRGETLGPYGFWEWLSPLRGAGFWSANRVDYTIRQWDTTGTKTTQFARRPSWFSEVSKGSVGDPGTPPPPRVAAMRVDGDGLAWVFVNVAAPGWSTAWDRLRKMRGRLPQDMVDDEKLYHTNVEVIDPATARVVARATIESWVISVLDDGRAASIVSDAGGRLRVRLSTLTLVRN